MADYDKVIPPGQEGKIKAKIYGHKIHPGRLKKSYTVTTNDPENKKIILFLAGEVKKVFEFSKNISLTGYDGDRMSQETSINIALDEPIQIKGYHWKKGSQESDRLKELLDVKLERVEKGKRYKLSVSNKKDVPSGRYMGELILETDFDMIKEKSVRIRVTVTPDVVVSPETLFMGEMYVPEGVSKSFDRSFSVVSHRGDSLKVLKVVPGSEDMTVNIQEIRPGKAYRCKVRLRPESKIAHYASTVKIFTNYPGYEEMMVNIRGTVRVGAQATK